MEKISGIYKIVNKVNGKYYVGSSVDILTPGDGRFYNHKNLLSKNKHHCSHLQRAWLKYGPESFDFIIVQSGVPVELLSSVEQSYLDIAKTERDRVYNSLMEAGNTHVVSDDTRSKFSYIKKRKYSCKENHPRFGKPMNTAMREGLLRSNTKLSDEQLRDIRSQFATGNISRNELAIHYNVKQGYMSRILNNKTRPSAPAVEKRRVTVFESTLIKHLYKTGRYSMKDLSLLFEIPTTTLCRCLHDECLIVADSIHNPESQSIQGNEEFFLPSSNSDT